MLQQHHKELDGYRGIAILMVVFYHYFDGLKIFRSGWLGVDLFFILSGFLITSRLLKSYLPQKNYTGFWMARALKILPPLLLLFVAYFVFVPLIATPNIAHDIRVNAADKWWYFSFTQNWLYVNDGYPAVPHLAFLWSLAVQVQFYVLLFIITLITRKPQHLLIVFIIIALVSAIVRTNMSLETTNGSFTHYMYNTFTRLDTFAGGVILYCLLSLKKIKQPMAILLFLLPAAVFLFIGIIRRSFDFSDPVVAGPGIFIIIPAATTLLYFVFNNTPGWLGNITRQPLFVFPGRISYSLYLFHIPVFTFLSGRIYSALVPVTGNGLFSETLSAIICLSISILVSFFSYRFIEQPAMNYKKRIA